MKRLATFAGAFLGFALVCMSLAQGQLREPALAPSVGVSSYLTVGRTYTFRFDDHKDNYSGKVVAKPEGGWVLVERSDLNNAKFLVNLIQVRDIR